MRRGVVLLGLTACTGEVEPVRQGALCLAGPGISHAETLDGGAVTVSGTVTAHAVATPAELRDFDDVVGGNCDQVTLRLAVEDAEGAETTLFYGLPIEGEVLALAPGDAVDLLLRPVVAFGEAAGAVVTDDAGLVAALELGVYGSALRAGDVPGLTVEEGDEAGRKASDCGTITSYDLRFVGDDTVTVAPGAAASMSLDGRPVRALNMGWWDYTGQLSCTDVAGNRSWAVLR